MKCPKCGNEMTYIYDFEDKARFEPFYACMECGEGVERKVETMKKGKYEIICHRLNKYRQQCKVITDEKE